MDLEDDSAWSQQEEDLLCFIYLQQRNICLVPEINLLYAYDVIVMVYI